MLISRDTTRPPLAFESSNPDHAKDLRPLLNIPEVSMRPAPCRALVLFASLWLASPSTQAQNPKLVADGEARTPAEERAGFHLPEGFVIELVASEPMINKPMNLAFDARGRLWVTSTTEYPYPVKDGKTPRDRVVILSDFADDGKASKAVTFAEGLNIPIGILPLDNGDAALVHDIPNIRRFLDTDGDGKADKIEPAYEKYGFRDTHGMTNAFSWGFDGWIYACHGFNNESTVKGSDGKPIVMQSGNVYRMRPDGSHAEYYSHGQVNPFGLAFDPMGNLYSCDCHSRPLYQLIRGAYYPSFGKPDDGLGFGPEMISHDHGSTGIGGIVYYAAEHFPPAYRDNLFIGNVVTSRINQDRLDWKGSSPVAIEQPDFVVSDDPWFRPVDMELGPDGALYVADFYNRIIGHYEVPLDHPGRDRERGRIWRIVYKGKDGKGEPPKPPRPDETLATVAELIEDLGHPNLAVRTIATNLLVLRGAQVIKPVEQAVTQATSFRKIHGLWVLQRLGALAPDILAKAIRDPEEAVRVHAIRILGESTEPVLEHFRNNTHRPDLALLGQSDPSPRVRRAMAETLGRHPSVHNIHALLIETFKAESADSHLKQTVKIALRDQLLSSEAWDYVLGRKWADLEESYLAEVALGVPMTESARFLLDDLDREATPPAAGQPRTAPPLSLQQRARYARHVARFGGAEAEASLVKFARLDRFPPSERVVLLKAIQQGTQERGGQLGPDARGLAADVATSLLASNQPNDIQAGIELAGSMKLDGLKGTLATVATVRGGPTARRTSAMTAMVAIDPVGSVAVLGGMVRDSAEPIGIREAAANALVGLGKPETRAILVEAMAMAPARLQTTIATGLAQNRPGAEALLGAVAAGKASARPLQERGVAVRLEASGVPDIKSRLESLLKDLPPADQRVQSLIDARRSGFLAFQTADRARGVAVFEKNCAGCHQLEGKGARVGPQLDGVGLRGLDRLLEDTLDPNRNVDQAFRVTTLALADGRIASGLLLRQDGEVLILADAQGKDVRVPASTVEDRKLSQLSPMPANWGEQIEEADFNQLIAYLLSCRPAK
jgi:putative heme-binding domain-containing protein